MKVIEPTVFNAATHLVSSNVIELHASWAVGTTYAKGARVDYLTHIYESLVNSNTGHQPDTSPTQWLQIGPDNTHAMFDTQVSTATTRSSPLTVVLSPGLCNSLAFYGLVGQSLSITITDGSGGPTVYSRTISLDGTFIFDWYQYFFEPSVQIAEVVRTDIPPYANARITISLSGTGTVQIGQCVFGTQHELGDAQYGASIGIIDYSVKTTDAFGVTTFLERANSDRLTVQLMLHTSQINRVRQVLRRLRATPAVWLAVPDDQRYVPFSVYGFFKDFNIEVSYPTQSWCSLEIEGLT